LGRRKSMVLVYVLFYQGPVGTGLNVYAFLSVKGIKCLNYVWSIWKRILNKTNCTNKKIRLYIQQSGGSSEPSAQSFSPSHRYSRRIHCPFWHTASSRPQDPFGSGVGSGPTGDREIGWAHVLNDRLKAELKGKYKIWNISLPQPRLKKLGFKKIFIFYFFLHLIYLNPKNINFLDSQYKKKFIWSFMSQRGYFIKFDSVLNEWVCLCQHLNSQLYMCQYV